jgi:hypothetical protein
VPCQAVSWRPLLPLDQGPGHAGQAGLPSLGPWWPPGPPSSLLARHEPPGNSPWDGLCWPHGGVGDPPSLYDDLLTRLREVFSLDCVDTGRLLKVKLAAIYKELTLTLHTPLVEQVRPDLPLHCIWLRRLGPYLVAREVDLHNFLDVQAKSRDYPPRPKGEFLPS